MRRGRSNPAELLGLLSWYVMAAVAFSCARPIALMAAVKPNFVIISSDDTCWRDVGYAVSRR